MEQSFCVYVSVHPSGGWCVNIPNSSKHKLYRPFFALTYDKIISLLKPFSVWQNSPSIEGCIELEFIREMGDGDFKQFQNWIRWSIGIHVPDLQIVEI